MFYAESLEKAIEEALVQKGIQSEVKIAFFSMSPDSEAEINAFKKAYDEHLLNTIMHMDNALNIQNEEAFGRHSYWNCMYTSKPEAVKFYEQQSANVNSQDGENR